MTVLDIDSIDDIVWCPLFDTVSDLVSLHSSDGSVLNVNKAFADFFGKSPDAWVGEKCFNLFRRAGTIISDCPIHRMLLADKKNVNMELEIGEKIFDEAASPVRNRNNEVIGCIHILRDITVHKQIEKAREETERLKTVVEMAGGISHDINQPLTVFSGYMDLLQRKLPEENEKLHDYLVKMKDEIERMKEISKKLANVTRYRATDYPGSEKIFDLDESSKA